MDKGNNPLIINGSVLARTGKSPSFGGDPNIEERKLKRNLVQARAHILPQIAKLETEIEELPEINLLKDIYFRINYPNAFLAKSYQVSSIYSDSNLQLIGSADWKDDEGKEGRSDFLLGTKESIDLFTRQVKESTVQIQQKEIRRMEEVSLLLPLIDEKDVVKEKRPYELVFHSVVDIEELFSKFQMVTGLERDEFSMFQVSGNVVFIVCTLTKEKLKSLKKFNPLRAAYPADNRDFSAANFSSEQVRNQYFDLDLNSEKGKNLPWIGLIDGGIDLNNHFFRTIEQTHVSHIPPSFQFEEHGTSVASILLFGELKENRKEKLVPSFRIQSIRALPSEEDLEFNLLTLDQMILDVIPKYPNVKIWNLSIGPVGPIQDEVVSSLTRTLDKVAYENDVIFVIAAGNTGEQSGIAKRIQIPGDSVNNLTVSAYYSHQNKKSVSPYSSMGLGREGAKLKPDLIDHGGLLPIDPIYTLSSYEYLLNKVQGTSFSAPNIARKLALILGEYPDFSVWEARALLEHSLALRKDFTNDIQFGSKGELDKGPTQLLTSNEDEIRIMYSGTISAKGYVELPVPVPDDTNSKTAIFTWTIVTKTKVNPDNTDKYTEYGIEDDFYPNIDKYIFRYGKKQKQVDLSTEDGEVRSEVLLNNGFTKSLYPKKENTKYMDETERRKQFLKWDTSKTQRVTKRVSSLNKPFIRLHGLSRSESRDRINYVMVVTVNFLEDTNIYNNVLFQYPILRPVQISSNSRQQI
ncbi:MAG: S8 family peptidase [Tetragenococcus halophilus]|nr:S8 family peptidase [Tetragenococcus halophilus]MDN6571653.1 S8 family peptidase [Staphylococcus equorum]MDN6728060.1 S8 family peptidase [Tetragenococcus halophilus]MDN6735884.1 S8 family peptidase [Tetragenococcus koreensis]MDN6744798.1 S8 family peptidase [Tetragenococcus halophilus]